MSTTTDPTKAASPPLEPSQRGGLRRTWDPVMNRPGVPIYDENYIEPGAAAVAKPDDDAPIARGFAAPPMDPKNTAFHYHADDPLPPVASPATLEVLARSRGTAALDECVSAVRALDRILSDPRADDMGRAAYERRGSASTGSRKRPPYRPVSIDVAARRTIYHGRCVALAKLLQVGPPAMIDPRLTTAAQARGELAKVEAGIGDQGRLAGNADAYGRLGFTGPPDVPEIDELIGELAERRAFALTPPKLYPVQGGWGQVSRDRPIFAQDVVVRALDDLHRRKAELLDQVVNLEALEAARDRAASEKVASTAATARAAVDGSGGVDAVVDRLIVARALAAPPIADPSAAAVAGIDEELARLEAASIDPSSRAVVSLQARRERAIAEGQSTRQGQASRRRAAAEDLVREALAGGATAAAEVTALLSRGDQS